MVNPTQAASAMELKVRYVECDMQGRVFNAHYLTWVDMAHTEAIDELLGGYRQVVAAGVDLVVAAADLQFRSPARFDDRLTVHTTIHPPGNTSLRSDFTITRGEDLLAECRMIHVCVDATTYEKQPWPQWLRAKLPVAA
ncbi:acyl-CoA thioesterase [[Mycobacterium] burgundiense]|uniref:Thioesterase family protein n=1 Tax=[Mycobacterium] burgundiense TaxID=3064286 RepID=A0ABM9LS57_9MYCO|nr:thioesterase family protein [Mycolicibacterium sp. MU0053]CAJ1503845.1 thioesterase family protein [Mycolicibacterium sp. MU0053]